MFGNKFYDLVNVLANLGCLLGVFPFRWNPLLRQFKFSSSYQKQRYILKVRPGESFCKSLDMTIGFISRSKRKHRKSNLEALTQTFFNSLSAKVTLGKHHESVPAMKAYHEEEFGKIRLVFTASKGGHYKVQIRYNGFPIPGTPYHLTVPPDVMFAGQSEVQVPSTPILLTDLMPQRIVIAPRDRTGYPCSVSGVRLDHFDFHASTAKSCTEVCGKTCELIGRDWKEVLEASFSLEDLPSGASSESCSVTLVLRISYSQPSYGIFEGQILYAGQLLKNGSFPIVSLKNEEYEKMESTRAVPRPSDVVQFKAELMQLKGSNINANDSETAADIGNSNNVQEKVKDVYVNITMKFICIKEVLWRVILSRTAIFKIQGDTKVASIFWIIKT
ncbi:unnamed protein product [Orchesella dallaii]|uniref:Uncharacterized protein n=1 Tax=Orchesella dallaii TaxID=48710 RepID=A0ABP1QLA4_9HEXA